MGNDDLPRIVRDLAEKCFKAPVDLDTPVDEAADSLKLSELVVALEQRFDIALDDTALGRVRVLNDLIALVRAKLPSPSRP